MSGTANGVASLNGHSCSADQVLRVECEAGLSDLSQSSPYAAVKLLGIRLEWLTS